MNSTTINSPSLMNKLLSVKDNLVLVIGDVMLDEYHWCRVNRISPEAPVPVCVVERTTLVPGGAANVAFNIQALGGKCQLYGVLGADSSGEKLAEIIKNSGIQGQGLITDKKRPTILKSRIVAHHQHVVRVDREEQGPINRTTQRAMLDQIKKNLPNVKAILLSDYAKGTLPDSFLKNVITMAKKTNIPVVIDPKGDSYLKYKGATLLTPNFREFQDAVKRPMKNETAIKNEAVKLIKRYQLQAILVTRSEKGMSIVTRNGEKIDIATQAKEVFDITGAGDTVNAVLTLLLSGGISLEESAYLANIAAGIVVGKVGTSTTSIEEIGNALQKES